MGRYVSDPCSGIGCNQKASHRGWHEDDFGYSWENETPGAVPIPLPPEPPHDRVIEAVAQDGTVVGGWRYFRSWDTWRRDGKVWGNCWEEIVRTAMRSRWTLRHVAAEEAS